MGTPQQQSPQLVMTRPTLDELPAVELPDGYTLGTYRPGDGAAWAAIITESFQRQDDPFDFDRTMRASPAYRPQRVFFIRHGDQPVATASAWRAPALFPDGGVVHYVGALEAHRGRRLGYQVSLATLHRMRDEGLARAWLQTDDPRLAAINIYLTLGFVPWLVHENQRGRWRTIFTQLGRDDLIEQFAAILDGEVHAFATPAADGFDYDTRLVPRRRWLTGRTPGRTHVEGVDCLADESLYRPSELGEAGCSVEQVPAGAERGFELWFRVGPAGLPEGAEVRFHAPGQRPLGPTRLQADDPQADGFVSLSGGGVELLTDGNGLRLGFRVLADLAEGAELRLAVNRFRWTPLAGPQEIKVIIIPGRGEPNQRLPEPVVVRVTSLADDHTDVFLPGTAEPGTLIRATVCVRDEHENRTGYCGVLEVFAAGDVGEACIDRGLGVATLEGPSAEPLQASAEGPVGEAASNWCLPVGDDGLNLYFGDLHVHDLHSEAAGWPTDIYLRARDELRLDFLSVPIQCHAWQDIETWTVAKHLAEAFLDEGRFITIPAFEWQHSRYGDKVVHYLGNDQPMLPVDVKRYASAGGLYEALRGSDALIVSHHPGYELDQHVPGADWDAMETDVDRLVEIWSMHGSSEGFDPQDRPLNEPRRAGGVVDGLRKGLRFGFVGGSDTHMGRPGGGPYDVRGAWGGLCAVWAERLTRRSLFEALRARRTYALTRARIALRFTVNGAPMGSEIAPAADRRIVAEAWAPGPIRTVQIMKNAEVLHHEQPGGEHARIEIEDAGGDGDFYHCRVVMADENLAVCSPVWVG